MQDSPAQPVQPAPDYNQSIPQNDPALAADPLQGYQIQTPQTTQQTPAPSAGQSSSPLPRAIDQQPLQIPPPIGSSEEADRYLAVLAELISRGKLALSHTDLNQFDPSTLQDHYRVDLGPYEIEISHSKQPDTNKDFYIMLFNNLKKIQNVCTHKVILAYIHLSPEQFKKFKASASNYLEQRKAEAEKERFESAMIPIDDMLKALGGEVEDEAQAPQTPAPTRRTQEKSTPPPAPVESVAQETITTPQDIPTAPSADTITPPISNDGTTAALPIENAGVNMPVQEVLDDVNTATSQNQVEPLNQQSPSDFISQMYNGSVMDENNQQAPQNQVVV